MEKHLTEFYVNGEGQLWMRDCRGDRRCLQGEVETISNLVKVMKAVYPSAYEALAKLYKKSSRSPMSFDYKIGARFIRCNMGEDDTQRVDLEGDRLNLEQTKCPLKGSGDCPLEGVVCNPKATGFSPREREVVGLYAKGLTPSVIAEKLGNSVATIKSHLNRIKARFNLERTRDIITLAYTYNII